MVQVHQIRQGLAVGPPVQLHKTEILISLCEEVTPIEARAFAPVPACTHACDRVGARTYTRTCVLFRARTGAAGLLHTRSGTPGALRLRVEIRVQLQFRMAGVHSLQVNTRDTAMRYEVRLIEGCGSSQVQGVHRLEARDAEDAQDQVIGELEAKGWWHADVQVIE